MTRLISLSMTLNRFVLSHFANLILYEEDVRLYTI